METGAAVLPEHYDVLDCSPTVPCPGAFGRMRDWLADTLLPQHALGPWVSWDEIPPPVQMFAYAMRDLAAIRALPIGGLAQNSMVLGWHQDRHAPPNTTNLTTVMRHNCTGGLLVMNRHAYRMLDGEYLLFDPRVWHGLTALHCEPGGWRISATLYIPRGR